MVRRWHRLIAIVVLGALAAVGAPSVGALERDRDESPVQSDGDVVRVILVRTGGDARVVGVERSGGSSSDSTAPCTFHVAEIPEAAVALAAIGVPPTPDATPYWLYCGSALWGAFWVTPADIVDYDAVARAEAERYVQTILGPALEIEHAPAAYAVTGASSHHWVTGWDGQPIVVGPIAPYGEALTITLRLSTVTWEFGDGTSPRDGDLGSPVPSTVQHTYTHRSTRDDPDGSYPTTATITIDVSYTIDGGAPISVTPPLTTTPAAPVVVRELQAVLD